MTDTNRETMTDEESRPKKATRIVRVTYKGQDFDWCATGDAGEWLAISPGHTVTLTDME